MILGRSLTFSIGIERVVPLVRGFLEGLEVVIGGGGLKMVLAARGLANELRGSIGRRISDGKVFKIDFSAISKIDIESQMWISAKGKGRKVSTRSWADPSRICLRSRMLEVI